jgi:hypothetical protein
MKMTVSIKDLIEGLNNAKAGQSPTVVVALQDKVAKLTSSNSQQGGNGEISSKHSLADLVKDAVNDANCWN